MFWVNWKATKPVLIKKDKFMKQMRFCYSVFVAGQMVKVY